MRTASEIHADANDTQSQRPERLLIFNVAQHSLRSCWCCRTAVSINCPHTHTGWDCSEQLPSPCRPTSHPHLTHHKPGPRSPRVDASSHSRFADNMIRDLDCFGSWKPKLWNPTFIFWSKCLNKIHNCVFNLNCIYAWQKTKTKTHNPLKDRHQNDNVSF